MAATYDTVAYADVGPGNSSVGVSITVAAGHSNLALIVFVNRADSGSVTLSSVSGGSASWSSLSSGTGNGFFKGNIWVGIAPASGLQTITATLSGNASNGIAIAVVSAYTVNQTTPAVGSVYTTAGNNVINVASGDLAYGVQFDNNTNRTVSGCTTTLDDTGFASIGHSEAHCTGTPTSTFTWSGFDTNSLAIGVDIQALPTGPIISVQPSTQVSLPGATAAFTITATSSGGVLHYQWTKNGSNVGSDSSSYTTPAATLSDNLSTIQCVTSDDNGTTNSDSVYWMVTQTASEWLYKA